jgi:Kef-type K+ transport system membrane component KefB
VADAASIPSRRSRTHRSVDGGPPVASPGVESASATLFVILMIAFLAPLAAGFMTKLLLPALVFEIVLGIIVGPSVLGLVKLTNPISLLSDLGLSALIFLAGFELDLQRVRGRPLELATAGWVLSVALGILAGLVLMATGVIVSELYVGLALTTTALGTLLPIIRDAGLLPTRFGTHVLAIGSLGEFGPIIAIAVVLSQASAARAALSLLVFVAFAVAGLLLAARFHPSRFQTALGNTLRSSGQLYIRLAVVLIAVMAFVADELGLDFLLGAFTAGVLYRIFLLAGADAREREVVESKLEAVTFGYLIPIFFVVTGVRFDLESLASPTALLKIPLFLGLFLVVRGLPMLLYRREIPDARERRGLALLAATALPMVVAITTIGVAAGQMRSSTQAALVGAAMLSVCIYPMIGMRMAPRATPSATPVVDEEPT